MHDDCQLMDVVDATPEYVPEPEAEAEAGDGIAPLKLWDIDDILNYQLPENDNILGDRLIAAGELTLIVGPPDIGKSRLVTQLVFDILLGRPQWLDQIPIHQAKGFKVMMVGTENGIRRWSKDVTAQLRGCTSGQRQSIKEALRIMIPMTPEERDMNLNDRMNGLRLRRTIKEFSPDLIVFDPYGDFFAGDNENDAVQTRRTVKTLMSISQSANPQTAVIVVHHARSGKAAAAGADGWDRGAYARGSKALLSIARAQINIAPGDKDGKSLVIACGKNNNGPKFEAFGVRLDPESMRYEHDPNFSLEEWSEDVGDKRKTGPGRKVHDGIMILALREKALSHNQLVQAVVDATECSLSTAKRAVADAVERGVIVKGAGFYCLPAPQGSWVQVHEPDTQ